MKPYKLYDEIKKDFNLKSDAALARFLNMSMPNISKVRSGHLNLGANSILNIYDKTGWSIEKIRGLL